MTKDELNAAIRELCEAMGMTFMPWEIRPWSAGADRHGPRHAYALALMLDLDLGETRFVEQLGKLADEVLVEGPFLFGHRRPLLSHQLVFLL